MNDEHGDLTNALAAIASALNKHGERKNPRNRARHGRTHVRLARESAKMRDFVETFD
jgi:hypothetical protein